MKQTRRKPDLKACKSCPLYKHETVKTWYVPTEYYLRDGSLDVLFVGEAPGRMEDEEGLPFVGNAGDFLRKTVKRLLGGGITGLGLANIVRCRPTETVGKYRVKDRKPSDIEVACCSRHVKKDIALLKPKSVMLLGSTAIQCFFPDEGGSTTSRGKSRQENGITYVFSYHPSYVLRNGGDTSSLAKVFESDVRKALVEAGIGDVADTRLDSYAEANDPVLIKSIDELKGLAKKLHSLEKGSVCFVDTEDDNLNRVYDSRCLSIQFCWDGMTPYIVLVKHPKTPFTPSELEECIGIVRGIFTEKTKHPFLWGFHNAMFDLHVLRREFDCEVENNKIIDTMQVEYLLDENKIRSRDPAEFYYPEGVRGLSLAQLTLDYLGPEFAYDEADKAERHEILLWDEKRFIKYACEDVWKPWRILKKQLQRAEKEGYRKQLLKLILYLYSGQTLALADMEHNGIKVDIQQLIRLKSRDSALLAEMKRIEEKIREYPEVQELNSRLCSLKGYDNRRFVFKPKPWFVSLSSKDQLRTLFFDICKYDPVSQTEKGVSQVNKAFFEANDERDADDNSTNLPSLVSDWKDIGTLYNTFVKGIYKWVHPDRGHPDMAPDSRVRCELGLTSTTSGRLSHSNPNLSAIPKANNEWRKAIKNVFVVDPGNVLLAADLSANEVRWGANCAGDTVLGNLFQGGVKAREEYRRVTKSIDFEESELNKVYRKYLYAELTKNDELLKKIMKVGGEPLKNILVLREVAKLKGDIHRMTASEFFDTPVKKVTDDLRRNTKGIVFGYMYGRGVRSIAEQVKRSEEETYELCKQFDERYPDFANRLQTWPDEAEENGFVESPIGRRRRFHRKIWEDAPESIKAKARRQAKNSPIQGVAYDTCAMASILLYEKIRELGKRGSWKPVNTIHDALYLELPFSDMEKGLEVMEHCMTTGVMDYMTKHFGVKFVAPMECEFKIGLSWGSGYTWDYSPQMLRVIRRLIVESQSSM